MSVQSPFAMAGHPISCAFVGAGNEAVNHSLAAGWNGARGDLRDIERLRWTTC